MAVREGSDDPSQPMYRKIAAKMAEHIQQERFQDALPSQEELCRIYGVGRSTVREALRLLGEQGIIRVRQGMVTRIIGRDQGLSIKPGLESFIGVSKLLSLAGLSPGTSFTEIRRARSSAHFFPAFAHEQVILLERVRTANGIPVVLSIDVFEDRGWDLDGLTEHFQHGALLQLLEQHGISVHVAESHIHAIEADPVVAQRLGLRNGEPVLFIEEISYDESGKIVICSQDYYDPHHVSFRVLRRSEKQSDIDG